jgi:hypothetical protein
LRLQKWHSTKGLAMIEKPGGSTIREAVAVLETADELERAIEELQSSGFNRAEISLLADEHTVEKKLGHRYKRASELEDDPDVPRTAYVSTESVGDAEGGLIGGLMYVGAVAAAGTVVAGGGALAATLAAAALAGGASGFVGAILAGMVGERHADNLRTQLEKGGLLLWVRTRDADHEKRAVEVLSRHSAHDIHVHSVPVAGM